MVSHVGVSGVEGIRTPQPLPSLSWSQLPETQPMQMTGSRPSSWVAASAAGEAATREVKEAMSPRAKPAFMMAVVVGVGLVG